MECVRCQRNEKVVKLLDAIYENEVVKICEECVAIENIPIIRKPSSFQLKETEKPYTVYQRCSRMAGLPINEERKPERQAAKIREIKPEITLDNLRKPKDYSKLGIVKANKPVDLRDNFNWYIQRARRARGISQKQLAATIGESEFVIKMIENGELPDDGLRVIDKMQQFLRINLKKSEAEAEQNRIEAVKKPTRILSFDYGAMKNITISDLQRMKLERERLEQEEKEKGFASKIVWKGMSKEEREKKEEKPVKVEEEKVSLIGKDIEIIDNSE